MKEYYKAQELEKIICDANHVVKQIDKLREDAYIKKRNGISVDKEVLNVMADSMMEVIDVIGMSIHPTEYNILFRDLKNGTVTEHLFAKILSWEKDVLDWLEVIDASYATCNICGNRVLYQANTEYFQNEQRKHGFPYWNAVFESLSKENRTCPVCQSMDRERMLTLFIDLLRPEEGKKLNVLQIAPSAAMDNWLNTKEYMCYETTDLMLPNVSFQADIQDMHNIKEETYDIILCSHVLEHVEDDQKAMRELRRILKDDGVCLFLVPLVVGLDKTDEEFGLDAEENWKRFGQNDHARLYAKEDFLDRLTKAGYLVHILGKNYFGEEVWKQQGLSDVHYIYAATKRDIGIGVAPYQPQTLEEEIVSVIIPTYNRGYCIERSINSVLNQTWKNLEVIVVDDASTDDTERIVGKLKDSRIEYIKLNENRGANYARNVGLKRARGKYVAFNDSDDEWLPTKLEKQMRAMRLAERTDENVGCVYCIVTKYENEEVVQIAPDLSQIGENAVGDIYKFMQSNMFISTQTLLIKKSVLEEVGFFNEELKRLQDWELLLRVAQKFRFTLVQESLVKAYLQPDSISKNTRGFIDTVFYVIGFHNMAEKNREAYRRLVKVSINLMKQEKQPRSYMENKFIQIEEEGVFTEEEVTQMKNAVGLQARGTDCEKQTEMELKVQELTERVNGIAESVSENNRVLNEILWAQIFNSAKSAFKWLPEDIALWPGRWGVGYQYMYVMARILNDVQPQKILETGLGQSTRLIGSYVKWMCEKLECIHLVIEHDQNWIDKFKSDFQIGDSTQIVQRQLNRVLLNDGNHESSTYIYQNFNEVIGGKKFHLISLDGPYGTDERFGYSRIDILSYLPECLEKSFCIVIDDYDRWGEKNTVEWIKAVLRKANIHFAEAVYRGTQDMYIMVSEDLKFLCTL